MTTLDLSPKGCIIGLLSTNALVDKLPSLSVASTITANPSAVISATTFFRASNRSSPRYSSGTKFIEAIRSSSQLISSFKIACAFATSSL